MIQRYDFTGLLIFFASLTLLGFLVVRFFVVTRAVTFLEASPVTEKRTTVLLEGAEVAKISELGKEWVLHAPRVEKRDDKVSLSLISGTFFSNGLPLYEVKARAGQVLLGTSSVWLENVELCHAQTGERFTGKGLSWQGEKNEFVVEQVSFTGRGVEAECDELVYNVAQRKAHFRGDVTVRLGMGEE